MAFNSINHQKYYVLFVNLVANRPASLLTSPFTSLSGATELNGVLANSSRLTPHPPCLLCLLLGLQYPPEGIQALNKSHVRLEEAFHRRFSIAPQTSDNNKD